ncbi:MAG: hypothetical protein L6R39_004833 [Caloplaca ligustica]|nr:MAG: hypothetical protein L6R39_004833 [Caloplaca ligustica]
MVHSPLVSWGDTAMLNITYLSVVIELPKLIVAFVTTRLVVYVVLAGIVAYEVWLVVDGYVAVVGGAGGSVGIVTLVKGPDALGMLCNRREAEAVIWLEEADAGSEAIELSLPGDEVGEADATEVTLGASNAGSEAIELSLMRDEVGEADAKE